MLVKTLHCPGQLCMYKTMASTTKAEPQSWSVNCDGCVQQTEWVISLLWLTSDFSCYLLFWFFFSNVATHSQQFVKWLHNLINLFVFMERFFSWHTLSVAVQTTQPSHQRPGFVTRVPSVVSLGNKSTLVEICKRLWFWLNSNKHTVSEVTVIFSCIKPEQKCCECATS